VKVKNVFWGLFFICAAAMVVLSQMGMFFEIGWFSILLTVFLIPVMVSNLVKLNFYGFLFPLAFLFYIYAEPLFLLDNVRFWPLMLATLFLSIGFSLIFKRRRFEKFMHTNPKFGKSLLGDGGNVVSFSESFNSSTKFITSQDLERGYFSCSFGSMKLYFDKAVLAPGGAEIVLSCSFAGMELYVPRYWNVVNRIDPSFGSVDHYQRENQPGAPTLTLTGDCSFGGIKIFYV
jgi:hypothetical protein